MALQRTSEPLSEQVICLLPFVWQSQLFASLCSIHVCIGNNLCTLY